MKKALLLIDRGSKMKEVQYELSTTCDLIKKKSDYSYVDFCFLEVLPPYIEEGIDKCIKQEVDSITVVPLFLYPGMKLKDAVTQVSLLLSNTNKKIIITKPLSYQETMSDIILQRVNTLLQEKSFKSETKFSLLLIGHGSSDKRAREAFLFNVDKLKHHFKNVAFCFLELEPPDIDEGIKECLLSKPDSIIVVPYFLHKGIHIQKDIISDINKALEKYHFNDLYITEHIGVDPSIIDLIIYLAKEAENKSGLLSR